MRRALCFTLFASLLGVQAQAKDTVIRVDQITPPQIRASENTVVSYTGTVPTLFTGALDADDSTYNRPVSCTTLSGVGTAVPHDTVTINNNSGGTANFVVTSTLVGGGACGDANDTFFTLYNGAFNPAAPLTNCAAVNDDISGSTNRCSTLSFSVPAGESRIVAVAGFNNATDPDGLFPYEINFIGTTGTGGTGNLTITPNAVPFGSLAVGTTSSASTVTLANTGAASLDVTTLTAAAAPFARVGGTCSNTLPITIAAGTSCTLTYTFAPTMVGPANQVLTVTANSPGSGTITLSGTGAGAPAGNLTITPATVPFGNQNVGSSSAASTVTLANTGAVSLDVTALTAATAPFARSGGTCANTLPITIAAGANCTLTYTFSPTVAGAANQALTVTTNGTGSGTITLSGTGVAAPGVLSLSATTLDFAQNVGAISVRSLTLSNTGSGPLTVSAVSAVTAPFVLTASGTCSAPPISLAAGASCTLIYSFSPTAQGTVTQTVSLTSDGGNATLQLRGTGIVSIALPALSPLFQTVLLLLVIGLGTIVVRSRR